MSLILTHPYFVKSTPAYIPPNSYSMYRVASILHRNGNPMLIEVAFIDTVGTEHNGSTATSFTANYLPYYVYPSGTYANASDGDTGTSAQWSDVDALRLVLEMKFSQPFTLNFVKFASAGSSSWIPRKFEIFGSNDGTTWDYVGTVDTSSVGGGTVNNLPLTPPGVTTNAVNLLSKLGGNYPSDVVITSADGNIVLINTSSTSTQYEVYTDLTGRTYPASNLLYAEVTTYNIGCGGSEHIALVSQSGFGTAYVTYDTYGSIKVLNNSGTINNYSTGIGYGVGDVLSILYDRTAPSVTFWKNGTKVTTIPWDVTDAIFGFRSNCNLLPTYEVNGGLLPFVYTPPAGYTGWDFN